MVLFCFRDRGEPREGVDPDRDVAPATSIRLEVRLLDPQMVGRTWRQSTEAGHVHPRMTGWEQRLRISGWRYHSLKKNLYSDID